MNFSDVFGCSHFQEKFYNLSHGFGVLRFITQYQKIIFKITQKNPSDPEIPRRIQGPAYDWSVMRERKKSCILQEFKKKIRKEKIKEANMKICFKLKRKEEGL